MRLVPPEPEPGAPTAADDVADVERARTGDRAAQATLFRRHAPKVLPLLTRLLSSTADAEDALQDAFLLAFRDLGQLRDPAAFGGWLRRVAVHQAHRRFRRRRLLAALGLDSAPTDATLATLAHPQASPEVRAELARLDAALRRVPSAERLAWQLRYVEGYELTEVAEACDCSLATAKRRIAAAHARLAGAVALPEVAE